MATKLKRDQLRAADALTIGKLAAASQRREARETKRETPRSECESTTYRFDLADIRSITIERNSPLCLIIVVNPPRPA